MQCPTCGTEVQIQQGFCPGCGTFIGMPLGMPPQSGKKLQLQILVGGLLLLSRITIPAWLLWKSGLLRELQQSRSKIPSAQRPVLKQEHVPTKLSELHGHGAIYFIPLGAQAISPESLAAHYKKKFNLSITLLPAVPIDPSASIASPNQYGPERLLHSVNSSSPKLS